MFGRVFGKQVLRESGTVFEFGALFGLGQIEVNSSERRKAVLKPELRADKSSN